MCCSRHWPSQLRAYWDSKDKKGLDHAKLFDVDENSPEFECVKTIFLATPPEAAYYAQVQTARARHASWAQSEIVCVQRIENGQLEEHSVHGTEHMQRDLRLQEITVVGGVHTKWVFHGASMAALESIVNDPQLGFDAQRAGTNVGNIWGNGSYFARDAAYSLDYCERDSKGNYAMLLCLLSVAVPCQASAAYTAPSMLPKRRDNFRFVCGVDSLASPEIFVTYSPSQVYPAYKITFVPSC